MDLQICQVDLEDQGNLEDPVDEKKQQRELRQNSISTFK